MSDIVELREMAGWGRLGPDVRTAMDKAADEIERLRERLAAAERALSAHNGTVVGDGSGGWKHDKCRCPHCEKWREAAEHG